MQKSRKFCSTYISNIWFILKFSSPSIFFVEHFGDIEHFLLQEKRVTSSLIHPSVVIHGEAHKVLQSDSTQTIDHIQNCFRQKFQCLRMPSYSTTPFFYLWRRWSYVKVNSTFLNGTMYFFLMTLLPILRRIQWPTTQGHSSHAKYKNSRKIIFISFYF